MTEISVSELMVSAAAARGAEVHAVAAVKPVPVTVIVSLPRLWHVRWWRVIR